jgi:hypothetical protein
MICCSRNTVEYTIGARFEISAGTSVTRKEVFRFLRSSGNAWETRIK